MTTIRYRIDPLEKDIKVFLDQALGPKARSRALADFAQDTIDDANAINAKALGRAVPYEQWVDGRRGAALQSVKPEGKVIAEWDFLDDSLVWIRDELEKHSPYKSGRYQRSHKFFVDGVETDPDKPTAIKSVAWFVSNVPYARKIERHKAAGVYQAVAKLASGRFGNIAKIRFGYKTVTLDEGGETRNPSIDVLPR
jgi:hypothetical protein